MPRTELFIWHDLPAAEANGAQRREIVGAGASLKQVVIKAGTVSPRHSHDHEQFLLVLEGLARLTTESGTVELRPGMVVCFDPEAWHAAEFVRDTVLVEVNLRGSEVIPD
ncbi:cupin domain-containing protein [Azospirillum doebereinerae]|uniref:Cupin domain-containing protein n=1 Tax=Azospirillum doebereinerae TaxID=92933 RepID=A0A433J8W4_9PROT|nr:cupin domain-containing protein [Azospirillum doebereinerae]RUQ70791.1 cupin domain-containing protein [Azospirillum doebereinerae]